MNKKLIVKQNGYKDCGPSCLLSIMRYYGLEASHEEVSYVLKTDMNGTNAYNIINGSRLYGFDGYGIHYTYEEIVNNKITFPIICHVKINDMLHFIVIYKIKKNKLIIMDPASSNNKITKEYFKQIYLNTSLVIYPIKKIEKINNYTSLFRIIKNYLALEKQNIIIIFILSILTIILGIITNYYMLIGIDYILPNYSYKILLKTSIIFSNIYIIKTIFDYIKNKLIFNIEKNISLHINNNIIRKYFNLPYQYFKTKSTGEITSRLNDLNIFKNLFSQIIPNLLTNIILIIISMIVLLTINKKLFIINLIEIIIYTILVIVYKNKNKITSEQLLISNNDYEKILAENIYGYEINKNLNMINEILKKTEVKYISYLDRIKSYSNLINKQNFIKQIITTQSYIIVITLGISYINKGIISIGEFMLYNSVIYYFMEPLKEMLDLEPSFEYMKNIYNRINDILIVKSKKRRSKIKEIKENIKIEKLCYRNGLNMLFEDVSFEIKYGEKFLIYGNSGIGKSTLMKVIMKYLDDYEGNIYFGKEELKDLSEETIANNITYVSQNGYLNNDTFKNNIIYERNIDDETYEKVLDICNLKELRKRNKERNDFLIEEDGFNISGGERQKIILARSILKESNYYIFDESLSEVGIKEEKEIIEKLFDFLKDKTIIYISHKKEIIDMFKEKYKIERREAICYQQKNYMKSMVEQQNGA